MAEAVIDEKKAAKTPAALAALAKALVEATQRIDAAKESLTKANIHYDIVEKKLVDQMTTENVRAFRTLDLGLFYSQVEAYPRIVDKAVLDAFVKKRKSLKFLYTVSINGGKLKAYVKELMQASKPIPPGLDPFLKTVVRRRAK